MSNFSNYARIFRPASRAAGMRITKSVVAASFIAWIGAFVVLGIAHLAGVPVTAVPPASAGDGSVTENPAGKAWAYFPDAFVNQGEAVAEIYIDQF